MAGATGPNGRSAGEMWRDAALRRVWLEAEDVTGDYPPIPPERMAALLRADDVMGDRDQSAAFVIGAGIGACLGVTLIALLRRG